MLKEKLSEDWLIEVVASNGPCWIAKWPEGDPGRTLVFESAEKYATRNEAFENMEAIRAKFPRRRYEIHPVSHYATPRDK